MLVYRSVPSSSNTENPPILAAGNTKHSNGARAPRGIVFRIRVFGALEVYDMVIHTLRETNIAPENRAPQKVTSIPTIHF